jgi:uncharacterized integral membrane protein
MHLANNITEEDIAWQNEDDDRRIKIDLLENEIYSEQQAVDKLKLKKSKLYMNVKKEIVVIIIFIFVLIYIYRNASLIAIRFIANPITTVIFMGIVVALIGGGLRTVFTDMPMYIRCRKEEKGTSSNNSNYIYEIAQHERKINKLQQELNDLKQQEMKVSEIGNL